VGFFQFPLPGKPDLAEDREVRGGFFFQTPLLGGVRGG